MEPQHRCFNPHARAGRDPALPSTSKRSRRFNPHARAGRDTIQSIEAGNYHGFNPHARAGRDAGWPRGLACLAPVSIRTPVQGVTLGVLGLSWWRIVSIRTPVQGVTLTVFQGIELFPMFQSARPCRA